MASNYPSSSRPPRPRHPRPGPGEQGWYREPSRRFDPPPPPIDERSRWRRWAKRIVIGGLVLGGIGIFAFVIAVAYAWRTLELPPEVPLAQSTIITDAKGERLATINSGENRVLVEVDKMSPWVPKAVLAAEDKDFYNHGGINYTGILRAAVTNVRNGGVVQGGSTITQQYVKKTYVGDERTLTRKFKEAVLAVKLEAQLSKDEILERYLNAIYFGRGAYGVQAASRVYYGKDVAQLDVAEASYLAGLIRGPELADVTTDPDVAKSRRTAVLARMVNNGMIPQTEADAVAARGIDTYVTPRTSQEPSVVGRDKGTDYFISYVRRQLVTKFGEEAVQGGGLRVKTTLDPTMQAHAYDSVYGFLKPGEPAGALVSVDANGEIKAMVGGHDWAQSKVNLAVGRDGGGSGRQAGSTFKTFALAAAFEKGVCYKDTYSGPAKMVFPKADNGRDWTVSNYSNQPFGAVDLQDATVSSVNTVYAQLSVEVTPAKVAATAKAAGITSPLKAENALVLGTESVSPLEMADAYATFARGGVHVTPTAVTEVRDSTGGLLLRARPERKRVMSAETANTVNQILQQVVVRGTGKAAQIGRPIAGKTGTTEDYADAWFVGYTPNLSTAVWMGYPESSARKMTNVRGGPVAGGGFPTRIFGNYMKAATAGTGVVDFAKAPDCVSKQQKLAEQTTTTVPEKTEEAQSPTTTSSTILLEEFPPRNPRRGTTTTTAPATASTLPVKTGKPSSSPSTVLPPD